MSQNRFVLILKSSWKVLLPAALILGAGYGAKLYYTQQNIPEERTRAANVDTVMAEAVSKLEAHVSAFEGEGNPFPSDAGWSPERLVCADPTPTTPATWAHPTWQLLGVAPEGATRYQFRFRGNRHKGFELLARTDSDCDGIYQVRRIKGSTAWTGGLTTEAPVVDNPGE